MSTSNNNLGNEMLESLIALMNVAISGFPTPKEKESSLVKIDKFNDFTIDTVVIDFDFKYYESAIMHKDFDYGQPIILGKCSINENPLELHNKFVRQYSDGNFNTITDYNGRIYRKGDYSESAGLVRAMYIEDMKRKGKL